jgi:hypothetical protein
MAQRVLNNGGERTYATEKIGLATSACLRVLAQLNELAGDPAWWPAWTREEINRIERSVT